MWSWFRVSKIVTLMPLKSCLFCNRECSIGSSPGSLPCKTNVQASSMCGQLGVSWQPSSQLLDLQHHLRWTLVRVHSAMSVCHTLLTSQSHHQLFHQSLLGSAQRHIQSHSFQHRTGIPIRRPRCPCTYAQSCSN